MIEFICIRIPHLFLDLIYKWIFMSIFMRGWFYSLNANIGITLLHFNTLLHFPLDLQNISSEHLHVWLVLFVECQRQQHNKADSASSV